MKHRLRLKPKAREVIEVIITGIAIGVIGIIIANMMATRFHSIENDPRYYESKKKTDSPIYKETQISQK